MTTKGRRNHSWDTVGRSGPDSFISRCRHCGLKEQSLWLLDELGRATEGLAWSTPARVTVAVRPFAFTKSRRPTTMPSETWSECFPGVPVAGSPPCPKTPGAWARHSSEPSARPEVHEESGPRAVGDSSVQETDRRRRSAP